MSGLKREMSPDQVNNGEASTRERRSSFSSSTTGDSGYGGSVLGNNFLEHKTVQHYGTGDDYLLAMIEDLAEWFSNVYDIDLTSENLFSHLESGVLLCRHANEVSRAGEEYIKLNQRRDLPMKVGNKMLVIPEQPPNYRGTAQPGTFVARDNVANFIHWCRAFGIPDCLSFETEDLVLRKNVRSVVLCLLEIARVGAKFGMEAPDLVMMEQEIDAEIEADAALARAEADEEYELVEEEFYEDEEDEGKEPEESSSRGAPRSQLPVSRIPRAQPSAWSQDSGLPPAEDEVDAPPRRQLRKRMVRRPKVVREPYLPPPLIPPPLNNRKQRPRPKCDMKSLDEMVRDIIKECTCDETFPMKRLGEGKYQFGDNSTLIFVRILRYHVMVRVGGGWDTLNHFLEKYDPCRKNRPNGTKAPCTHGVGVSSRDQSEEPRPVRTSTPRKAATPVTSSIEEVESRPRASVPRRAPSQATSCIEETEQRSLRSSNLRKGSIPVVSCIEELEQRAPAQNRNFKEGMMNLNRNDSRARTVSVDAGLPSSIRQPSQASSSVKVTLTRPPKEQETDVQTRQTRSKTQEPTSRIGSLYLHNTVDELRKQLHDLQSSINSKPSSMEGTEEQVEQPVATSSEALSAREMYERMQRDFEMMSMGVDMSAVPRRRQDDDAVSVTSSCSSTSSVSATGRRASRIPVPAGRPARSNPTTPEMARRKPRAGSLQPDTGGASRPPRTERKPVDRRKSMDTVRKRPSDLTRRSSMSTAKASVLNGANR